MPDRALQQQIDELRGEIHGNQLDRLADEHDSFKKDVYDYMKESIKWQQGIEMRLQRIEADVPIAKLALKVLKAALICIGLIISLKLSDVKETWIKLLTL